jgi:purine nucleosidase
VTVPVLLDTDLAMGTPGSDIDDGFALALAVADPEIDLQLVTTINGNTDVDTATALTADLLHRLGASDVALHKGAGRALLRPAERHGQVPDSLAGQPARAGHAVNALIDQARRRPGELTLVAIGPLTNVALALLLDPEFATNLRALVIMGGVFAETTGQVSQPGEFNVWSDPEAAQIVLESGLIARWVGLDVTRQVRLDRHQAIEMAEDEQHPFAAYAGRHTLAWIDHLAQTTDPGTDSCPLHDPLAVVAVTRADLIGFVDATVRVQLDGVARGVLVAERTRAGVEQPPNAKIAVSVRAEEIGEYVRQTLRRL